MFLQIAICFSILAGIIWYLIKIIVQSLYTEQSEFVLNA